MIHDFAQKFVILWGWRRLVRCFRLRPSRRRRHAAAVAVAGLVPVACRCSSGSSTASPPSGRQDANLSWPALPSAGPSGSATFSLRCTGSAPPSSSKRTFCVDDAGGHRRRSPPEWPSTGGWLRPSPASSGAAACSRIFLLAALLAGAEWLRGHLMSGFPWNSLGYAAEAFDGLSQNAAHIGMWGLTFLRRAMDDGAGQARRALELRDEIPAARHRRIPRLAVWAVGLRGVCRRPRPPTFPAWRCASFNRTYRRATSGGRRTAAAILQTLLAMSDRNVEPSQSRASDPRRVAGIGRSVPRR